MTSPTLISGAPASPILSPPVADFALTYEPSTSTREVRQSRLMTFSHQRRISVYSKRILARVLEQITRDDQQLRPSYQLRVSDIVADTEITEVSARSFAKHALREMSLTHWEFEDPQTKAWYLLPLLDSTKETRVGLDRGVITIVLNPQLAPYFVQISGQYTICKLDGYMNLHSWYAMRFYEILSTFRDTGWWEVSLIEFRQLMDCGPELDESGQPIKEESGKLRMKLAETKDLIKRTVEYAQRELASTPLAFTYQPIHAHQTGPGRKKIVGLRFNLINIVPTRIPAHWFDHEKVAKVIAWLRDFKVTDRNIVTYLPVLFPSGTHELIRAWEKKQGSNHRIDDKVKYCNRVFVIEGKKAQEERRQAALQLQKEASWAKEYVQQVLFSK
ncbi:MAG: RepB family plasmid replication initiator protein [Rickettsiaceae bacterium]|nr:MAG: RepB family plasmid replication initiator protein [Rickettsiaceae bacterium]